MDLAREIMKVANGARKDAVLSTSPALAEVNEAGQLMVDGWPPTDEYYVDERLAPIRPGQVLVVIPVGGVYLVFSRINKANRDDFDDEREDG